MNRPRTSFVLGCAFGWLLLACGDNAGSGTPDAANDAGPDGPLGLIEGQCRESADCAFNQSACFVPGESIGCGACENVKSNCDGDAICDPVGTGNICADVACACSPATICVAGCGETGCGEGMACNATTARCSAAACDANTPCPNSFTCSNGECGRTTCSDDAPCGGGYCVKGSCYAMPGTCSLPPP